jgi:hypothetical protein
MRRGLPQDRSHEIEAALASRQRSARLVTVLAGQSPHGRGRHVGRVADDQVVLFSAEGREEVRSDQPDAPGQPVTAHVDAGDGERARGDVGGVDAGPGKSAGRQYGQAARAGAQIERAADGAAIGNPGRERLAQQIGDVRARNDDPLVHVKAQSAEPGFARQVGRGPAPADTFVDQPQRAKRFPRADFAAGGRIGRQTERVEHQPGGLVPGPEGAVTVGKAGGAQPALALAHEATDAPPAGGRAEF